MKNIKQITRKKLIIITLLFAGLLFAQVPAKVQSEDTLPELPDAGLTSSSPFYFLDRLGETIQEFFAFNPEGKARLQLTFAAERIAEIKVVFESEGIEAKEIAATKVRLEEHITKAIAILAEEHSSGKDVANLILELGDVLRVAKSSLAQVFKERELTLEAQGDELEAQLWVARRAGDIILEQSLAVELGQIKVQEELLEIKEGKFFDGSHFRCRLPHKTPASAV